MFKREAPFFTRALGVKLRSTVSKCFLYHLHSSQNTPPEIFDVSHLMVTSTLAHPERGPLAYGGHMGTWGPLAV